MKIIHCSIFIAILSPVFVAASLHADPEKGPEPRVISVPVPKGFNSVDSAIATKLKIGVTKLELSGYLGISVKRNEKSEIVVEEVQAKSPAFEAGIKIGDVVTQLDNQSIKTTQTFREWLQTHNPNDTVKLGLIRDGKTIQVSAKLVAVSRPKKTGQAGVYLGAELADSSEGGGVFVERVTDGSPAALVGLKQGDRVVKLDGQLLSKADLLVQLLTRKKAGDALTFTVRRNDGKELDLKPTLTADRDQPAVVRDSTPTIWTKDSVKIAIIGIEFPDVKHNARISSKELSELFLSHGTYQGKGPTGDEVYGSLADWASEQSNGKFKIEGKAFDWIEVSKKRGDFIQGSGTSNKTAPLVEAYDKLLARDGKNALDGYNGIAFVYAGDRVRTNAGAVYYPHSGAIVKQGVRIPYFIGPEGGNSLTPIGVFAKPFCLMLGLPDLRARTENAGSEGLGRWCALSDNFETSKPQHLSAWAKTSLNWLKPIAIDPTIKQKLVLSPIEGSANECYKILVRPDGSEYFLLENRRKKGFDSDLPSEGLLIWRVVNNRPILEESHGIEGPTGPTVQLNAVPYPSIANNAFTPDTIPSSRSPLGGGLPVHITEIRKLEDGKIAFRIGYEFK